ncbi:MAG: cell division protein FtsZ [Chitinivibrionales bacterium]|nr:cell division protein FtsZ [Chitinivibrionales bacterium]
MEFAFEETFNHKAKMKVIGIGGAGGNAVNRMVQAGLTGVEFIAVNTDAMALDNNQATHRIQIGERITKGLGAGANPDIGKIALEEDRDKIAEVLEGSDMVFITAGMGGGTGTGGSPVVAQIAQEMDILTVAIVTRPFLFEGKIRDRNARQGIDFLRDHVDTIIVIPNQKLLSIVERSTSLIDAFKSADDVLYQSTKGISDLISVHGLVNLDFADVKTIMRGMGDALMGTGYAENGEDRAACAADSAIHSPLLDDISIAGARGILINITGGDDMTLHDVSEATQTIYDAVGEDAEANIIFGAVSDSTMTGNIRVTVIATGFSDCAQKAPGQSERPFTQMVRTPQRTEQMSFPLLTNAKKPEPELNLVKQEPEAKAEPEPEHQDESAEASESSGKSALEFAPPLLRNDNVKKDAQVFVHKGEVITHYQDDTDIPTFLRKQMQ